MSNELWYQICPAAIRIAKIIIIINKKINDYINCCLMYIVVVKSADIIWKQSVLRSYSFDWMKFSILKLNEIHIIEGLYQHRMYECVSKCIVVTWNGGGERSHV